jgi:hypothetical protein
LKYDVEETEDLSFISETLDKIHGVSNDYLEAPEAEEAIAAADTLARLRGKFYVGNSYTKSIDQWVANHPISPPKEMLDSAIRAIDRILTEPWELLELWSESDNSASGKSTLPTFKRDCDERDEPTPPDAKASTASARV